MKNKCNCEKLKEILKKQGIEKFPKCYRCLSCNKSTTCQSCLKFLIKKQI